MATIEIDGGTVQYDDTAPGGGPGIVLVHGWCGDRSHWAAQRHALADDDRRLITLDLPWHGASDHHGEISLEAFAAAVGALIEALHAAPAVVIGHSMGGMIAVTLAGRRPELVRAVVSVDSGFATPPENIDGLNAVLAALDTPDAPAAIQGLADSLYAPSDDPAERARISEQMTTAPPEVLTRALASMLAFMAGPGDAQLAALQIPAAAICAPSNLSDLSRLSAIDPALHVGQVIGCGHYAQVFAAPQVNAQLSHFLGLVQ